MDFNLNQGRIKIAVSVDSNDERPLREFINSDAFWKFLKSYGASLGTATVKKVSKQPIKSKKLAELPTDTIEKIMDALQGDVFGKNLKTLAGQLGIENKSSLKPVLKNLVKTNRLKQIRSGTFRRADLKVRRGRKPKPNLRVVLGGKWKASGFRAPKSIGEAKKRLARATGSEKELLADWLQRTRSRKAASR